jgi:hypothetical protein
MTVITVMTVSCAPRASRPTAIEPLDARVAPPTGWKVEREDQTDRFIQRVWVSPTGHTSYGVIRFTLPLPVGQDLALWGFLQEMKRSEGESRLVQKSRDDKGLRFIAEGGRYRVDGMIVTRGFDGWATYAGTLRSGPVDLDELELAVQARENTTFGLAE